MARPRAGPPGQGLRGRASGAGPPGQGLPGQALGAPTAPVCSVATCEGQGASRSSACGAGPPLIVPAATRVTFMGRWLCASRGSAPASFYSFLPPRWRRSCSLPAGTRAAFPCTRTSLSLRAFAPAVSSVPCSLSSQVFVVAPFQKLFINIVKHFNKSS